MGDIRRIDGLEISEDMGFQRKDWAAQRLGWALMAALIAAALAGLLGGSGPAAGAAIHDDASGLTVEYERLTRIQRPTTLTLRADPRPGESQVPLFVSSDYLRGVSVVGVTPQPQSVRAVDGGLEFVFDAEPGAQLTATFEIEPQRPGTLRGRAGRADAPVSFTQFSYP